MTSGSGIPDDHRPVVVSCGILKNEIRLLANKNQWPVKLRFLDSSLHIDYDRLSHALTRTLSKEKGRKIILAYGTCHPKMDDMADSAGAVRISGQNCVEILLGRERFTQELKNGAFFLFEDWARRWDQISFSYFKDWDIMREIFQEAHSYLFCLRTPCSKDFKASAEKVGDRLKLPLRWEDIGLTHLEKALGKQIGTILKGSVHDRPDV